MVALALAGGVLASCDLIQKLEDAAAGSADGETFKAASAEDEPSLATTLQSYRNCDGLLAAIKNAALERVGPFGFDDGNYWRREVVAVEEFIQDDGAAADFSADFSADAMPSIARDMPSEAPESSAAKSAPQAGVDFSGTNVQVVGVDEADIVKTDGRRIIVSGREWITVVDVTGDEPIVTGRVNVPNNYASEMLFHDDRLLLLSTTYGSVRPINTEAGAADRAITWETSRLTVTEVLLDGTPRRGNTLHVEGGYLSSRSIGSTAHVVFNHSPDGLGFVYPQNPRNESSAARATEANRQVVEESKLSDWLPQYRLIASDGSVQEEGSLLDCSKVKTPSDFNTFTTLGVLTIDLDAALAKGLASATFAGGRTIYASTENLYVVTEATIRPALFETEDLRASLEERYRTSIHKFSLSESGATYLASGSVKGHLLNQFSMNERGGHFFVAATLGTPWGTGPSSESFIHSLRQVGSSLQNVASVGNMGKGERIYSVRYIDDRAYVVTFRQVDPLYVVDLSDPAKMKVLGELKIPGYSAYLHPLGGDLIAGVGADATGQGRITGAKVSLFDVSDPSNPTEIDNWVLADAQSDVEWDHRAFLWWAPEKALVVPVSSWRNRDNNGALVLNVDKSEGISLRGMIRHDASSDNYNDYIYRIIRSLVIGDDLWTLSQAVLQSNDFASLEEDSRIRLPNT